MKTFIGAFAHSLSFVGSFAPAARADCDSTGHGVPGVVGPTATDTSITVSWLLLCPIIPSSMQLREGGTTQKNWQDGTLLGTESLAPLENGGAVTASHLMPLTPYLNLRLCAIWIPVQNCLGAPYQVGASTPASPAHRFQLSQQLLRHRPRSMSPGMEIRITRAITFRICIPTC